MSEKLNLEAVERLKVTHLTTCPRCKSDNSSQNWNGVQQTFNYMECQDCYYKWNTRAKEASE